VLSHSREGSLDIYLPLAVRARGSLGAVGSTSTCSTGWYLTYLILVLTPQICRRGRAFDPWDHEWLCDSDSDPRGKPEINYFTTNLPVCPLSRLLKNTLLTLSPGAWPEDYPPARFVGHRNGWLIDAGNSAGPCQAYDVLGTAVLRMRCEEVKEGGDK
jgi:hypothetical protein